MEKISIDGRVIPTMNGGHGSGNFGHSGRPGKVGGSGSGKGAAKSSSKTKESATEWMKKNISFPEDVKSSENMDFDEIVARMNDGEDFYQFTGLTDSIDREKVFDELAKRTGLDYDSIYSLWLSGDDRDPAERDKAAFAAGVEYAKSLTQSPRLTELKKSGKGIENDEMRLRDMVSSVWTYGDGKDSKYLTDESKYTSLSKKEMSKIVDDEWKYLDEHCVTKPAGTDSEGVSYRSIQYRPSEAKKKK